MDPLVIDGVVQFELPASGLTASPADRAPAFVVGPENALVAAQLRWLLEADDTTVIAGQFNPLVLVGPAGSGKSHLAQGLVRTWSQRLGDDQVAYFTAADFGRERQAAEAEKRLDPWRRGIRSKELVVIEDLDRMRSPMTIQCEACATVDAVVAGGGVVVVTMLREPTLCSALTLALRDRLAAGLTIRLQRPGVAARQAILDQFAVQRGIVLEAQRRDLLAAGECGSPVELLGRLACWSHASDGANERRLDPTATRNESSPRRDRKNGLKQIVAVAARYFGVTQAALLGPSRRSSLVETRNVVVHLARRLSGLSYAAIGEGLGGRDHTTIMHAERRAAARMAADPIFQAAVDELEELLR